MCVHVFVCVCMYVGGCGGIGTQIVGYVVKRKEEASDSAWKLIGTRSPQDPQVRGGERMGGGKGG